MAEDSSTIEVHSTVVRSEEPLFSELDGETVLLNADAGTYHGLDAVGTRIWSLIEQPMRVSALRDALCEEFEVEPEQCERDVIAFLERLREADLLSVAEVSPAPPTQR